MTAENHDQQRATLVKEINFLFRNPRLTPEERNQVLADLKKIVDLLKK